MSCVHFLTCLNLGSKLDNRIEARAGKKKKNYWLGYGADRGIWVRFPEERRDFLLPNSMQNGSDSRPPPIQYRGFLLGSKTAGMWNWLFVFIKLRMCGVIPPPQYAFIPRRSIKHWDNITITAGLQFCCLNLWSLTTLIGVVPHR